MPILISIYVDELVVGLCVTAAISNKLTVYGYQKGKLSSVQARIIMIL